MYLGAHVLLPEGFDAHPQRALSAGHQPRPLPARPRRLPRDAAGSEPEARLQRALPPARATTASSRSTAYQFYKDWTAPDFPRVLVVEIQHANPYYDDSYAVNSANIGPYGDAIMYELIPVHREEVPRHRPGLGALHVRRLDRRLGSAGGADVLSGRVQRRLRRLSRSDRLPRLHRGQHLRGQERVLRRGAVQARAAPGPAQLPGPRARHARADEPPASWCWARRPAPATSGTSGRRSTRRSAPTAIRSRSGTSAPA